MIYLKVSPSKSQRFVCAQPSGLDPNRARVGADEDSGFTGTWTGTWPWNPVRCGSRPSPYRPSDREPPRGRDPTPTLLPFPSRAAPRPPSPLVRYHLAISHLPLTAARNRPPANIGTRRVLAIDATFIDLHFACAADTRPVCTPRVYHALSLLSGLL